MGFSVFCLREKWCESQKDEREGGGQAHGTKISSRIPVTNAGFEIAISKLNFVLLKIFLIHLKGGTARIKF